MKITQIFDDNHLAFQEAEYTCGPVTLMNLLRLKGDFSHSEAELAKLCKTKPDPGTLEEDMVAAAKTLGLDVVEAKEGATIKELEQHIDNGEFVIVCYFHAFAGEGHYGLVTEYDDKAVYLRDCSLGFIRLKKQYFEKYWHDHDGSVKRWLMAVK
jgi:predicted double-glycine peptidase